MFSPDLVHKIRKSYSRMKNYRKVGKAFTMGPSSAWYVVKTDFDKPKKKRAKKTHNNPPKRPNFARS
jgi:hypothetical protein